MLATLKQTDSVRSIIQVERFNGHVTETLLLLPSQLAELEDKLFAHALVRALEKEMTSIVAAALEANPVNSEEPTRQAKGS